MTPRAPGATQVRAGLLWAASGLATLGTLVGACGASSPPRPPSPVDLAAVRARAEASEDALDGRPRTSAAGAGAATGPQAPARPDTSGSGATGTLADSRPPAAPAARVNVPVTRRAHFEAPGRHDESPAAVCLAARRGVRQKVLEAVTAEAGLRVASVLVDAQRARTGPGGSDDAGFVDSFAVLSGQAVLLGEQLTETPSLDPKTREQRCVVAGEVTVMALSPEGRCRVEATLTRAGAKDEVRTVREGEALALTVHVQHASQPLGLLVLTLDAAGQVAALNPDGPLDGRAGTRITFPSASDAASGLELRAALPDGAARAAESLLVVALPRAAAHAIDLAAASGGDPAAAFGRVVSAAMRAAPDSADVCWDVSAYELLAR